MKFYGTKTGNVTTFFSEKQLEAQKAEKEKAFKKKKVTDVEQEIETNE